MTARVSNRSNLEQALHDRETRRERADRVYGVASGLFFLCLMVLVLGFFGALGGMIGRVL